MIRLIQAIPLIAVAVGIMVSIVALNIQWKYYKLRKREIERLELT